MREQKSLCKIHFLDLQIRQYFPNILYVDEEDCRVVEERECALLKEQQCSIINEQQCRPVDKEECIDTNQQEALCSEKKYSFGLHLAIKDDMMI